MSSPMDQTPAHVATDELEGRYPGWPDDQVNESGCPDGLQGNAAVEAQQRWNLLARQGKWMIAVYQTCQSTKSDVVRLKRAHLNNQSKVRIEVQLGRVVREREADVLAVEDRRVLDVPEERILWYEIIDEIGPEDVPLFRAALERGVRASREIESVEPQASSDGAWVRPR